MKIKQLALFCFTSLGMLFTGCITETREVIFECETYPKIRNYNVSLRIYKPKAVYKSGTTPTISFLLTNKSQKKLKIQEWYADEPNNLIIFYRKKGSFSWKKDPAKIHKLGRRFTMVLNHNNSAFIEKQLTFIKKAPKGDYEYYAKLNMTSMSAKSEIYQIKIK